MAALKAAGSAVREIKSVRVSMPPAAHSVATLRYLLSSLGQERGGERRGREEEWGGRGGGEGGGGRKRVRHGEMRWERGME